MCCSCPVAWGREKDTDKLVGFIKERFTKLMYLITVCAGTDLAARAGVLDGRKAMTNKPVWVIIFDFRPLNTLHRLTPHLEYNHREID
jgi:putative intracellular protease/amidase